MTDQGVTYKKLALVVGLLLLFIFTIVILEPVLEYRLNPTCPTSLIAASHYRGTTEGDNGAPWQGYVQLSLSDFQMQSVNSHITYVIETGWWPFNLSMYVFYSDSMLPPISTQCRIN